MNTWKPTFAVLLLMGCALAPLDAMAQTAPAAPPELHELEHHRVTLRVRIPPGRREAYRAAQGRSSPDRYRARQIRYDRVAYPVRIQRAIESELRVILRASIAAHDERDTRYFSFALECSATLATDTLLVYLCGATGEYSSERGEQSDAWWSAHAWEVGTDLRRVTLDDLLLPGSRSVNSPWAPTSTGLIRSYDHRVRYEELGTQLNMQSILRRIPRAVQASTLAVAEREVVRVSATPLPFARAVLDAAASGSHWLFAPEGTSTIDTSTALVMQVAGGRGSQPSPHTPPLRLEPLVLTRPTQLRATPEGVVGGAVLPTHSFVRGVVGTIATGQSSLAPGQSVLVVATEGLVGWLPADAVEPAPSGAAVSAHFLQHLPAPIRSAAEGQVVGVIDVVGEGFGRIGSIVCAERAEDGGSVVGFVRTSDERLAWAGSLLHPGTLVDARIVSLRDGNSLMLLAWSLPEDAAHHHWEAYRMENDDLTHEPVFTLTLGLPDGPDTERVIVATELERRRVYYPFVVRGPGRTETLYTWNGTTLVARAAE